MNIVDGGAGNGVHALGFDGVMVDDIARQVLGVAGGREGSGHCKEHDFLALENITSVESFSGPSAPGVRNSTCGSLSPILMVMVFPFGLCALITRP